DKVARRRGYSVVKSYCGYGIGTLFHTVLNVLHYVNNKAIGVMKPEHIFTIERMINEKKCNDTLWPDSWATVMLDGGRSAQFEHTLLVTESGVEILTSRTHGSYVDRF